MNYETDVDLIITVVKKGWAEKALEASMNAGARGGTIMYGRGVGIHEQKTLLGMRIEPEKEILLTAVRSDNEDVILMAIAEAVELDKPGNGVSMVLPLKKLVGRAHMFVDVEPAIETPPLEPEPLIEADAPNAPPGTD
ncbi:MAG: P-II family nitrogen regulator [Candidatus Methanomethylophilaceae archaeon]|nr:P-II family nitrogen regulator [Candidatus Methanomethylophilaceae archaeon]